MNFLLLITARALIAILQVLPLKLVARIGRAAGMLFYCIDGRHRKVAQDNLRQCFPEKSQSEVKGLARENFRRIGENFSTAVRTAAMSHEEILNILEVKGLDILTAAGMTPGESHVAAVGHFGNFELYARFHLFFPKGTRVVTTYRGLRQSSLNELLRKLREKSGALFFERRNEGAQLRQEIAKGRVMVGLLADQHAGHQGIPIPFFGTVCSTSPAPALFALRYKLPMMVAICFRTSLARWCIEVVKVVPTAEPDGSPRDITAMMTEVNQALEEAVRRDPANWFWVHNRWKGPPKKKSLRKSAPVAPPETSVIDA